MPSVLDVIHGEVAAREEEGHLLAFTFINMDASEAFQQFGCRCYGCHLIADVELNDFVAVTGASVFDGAGDCI